MLLSLLQCSKQPHTASSVPGRNVSGAEVKKPCPRLAQSNRNRMGAAYTIKKFL